ncbi:MAG: hypothetical protein HOV68_29180 [Streptomycetaceae bacterium]|nr:hypothetical protein [Streptomycetaceae bacterium]
MASTEFTFVSGDLALDFVGTLGHRTTDRIELLRTPEDLANWAVAADLTGSTVPGPADDADLAAALTLREAVYRLATATRTGGRLARGDLAVVNKQAHQATGTVRLRSDGTLRRTGDVRTALADVARSAVELLGGPHAGLVRECEAAPCTRLYVDASHRGSRRWCDMRGCGNRAKAAAFRARTKQHTQKSPA